MLRKECEKRGMYRLVLPFLHCPSRQIFKGFWGYRLPLDRGFDSQWGESVPQSMTPSSPSLFNPSLRFSAFPSACWSQSAPIRCTCLQKLFSVKMYCLIISLGDLYFLYWGTGIISSSFPLFLWFYISLSCLPLAICLPILQEVLLSM